jgi:hypothetical protein
MIGEDLPPQQSPNLLRAAFLLFCSRRPLLGRAVCPSLSGPKQAA